MPGGSNGQGPSSKAGEDEDIIDLLEESEALEMVEFDPSVSPKDSWEPPKAMADFFGKHFNRALSDNEREAIMKDFPKPRYGGAQAGSGSQRPTEEEGQRPPFWSREIHVYKIQEHLLNVAGPLTCLWSDLLNKEATIAPENILLLVQRVLVLLGSVPIMSLRRGSLVQDKPNPEVPSY